MKTRRDFIAVLICSLSWHATSSFAAPPANASQVISADAGSASPWADAQTSPLAGVPVSMVVTVQGHHGSDVPNIGAEKVTVNENRSKVKVTGWVPLQGERAGLELFVLLDDSLGTNRGTQLEDVHHFIMAQPASTKIGIAYMQEGGTTIAQNLTADHSLAADALHVTLGNLAKTDSPYVALGDLIKRWPAGNDRREILMISNGVDTFFGAGANRDNVYLDSAVEEAQRAGVVVFTINTSRNNPSLDANRAASQEIETASAHPSVGSPSAAIVDRGRNYLAEVADLTGGISYYHESGAPISFAPYLEDAARRLNRQYLLTFLAKPGKKAGMQAVKVKVEAQHAEVVSAERVYVPAAP